MEEKMGAIEEILEELILNMVISLLIKVSDRNELLARNYRQYKCYREDCKHRNDIPF
jgi:hypothetical protein